MLEVIDKGQPTPAHPAPLLFVHGAWHGAWCWNEHFLDYFANRGYRALAVSLRGHGNSRSPRPLHACSLADYVSDVASVADSLPTRPIVIGHSMGGCIVQKYLESYTAPAAVLVASLPPRGIARAIGRIARRHPWIAVKAVIAGDTMAAVRTPRRVREFMFSPQTAESLVVKSVSKFQQESRRVMYIDLMFWNLPKPDKVSTTMLVLGAEKDGTFSPQEVRETARAYHTVPEFFPDMGHDMMLEAGWADVAGRIYVWLETFSLGPDNGDSAEQPCGQ